MIKVIYISNRQVQDKFTSAGLPAGTYLYRLSAGAFTETRKMLIII